MLEGTVETLEGGKERGLLSHFTDKLNDFLSVLRYFTHKGGSIAVGK